MGYRTPAKYIPTPEEIKEGTARIRESWSENTRDSRKTFDGRIPVVYSPVVSRSNRKLKAESY